MFRMLQNMTEAMVLSFGETTTAGRLPKMTNAIMLIENQTITSFLILKMCRMLQNITDAMLFYFSPRSHL